MKFTTTTTDRHRLLNIYLSLAQYPILGSRIRARMRKELFERGIVQPQEFEEEVRRMAIRSQRQEGLLDPFGEEEPHAWEMRKDHIRNHLTDLAFSQHFPFEEFEKIVSSTLGERGFESDKEFLLSMNPELTPLEYVLRQAMLIERMPPEERAELEHRLEECKVVLIRTLISDQLRYINIAKEWFTAADLADIRQRKIGFGRIGGKAAGMLLAVRLLGRVCTEDMRSSMKTVESYFIGADEFYAFLELNNFLHWMDQKYKSEDEMRAEFPQIQQSFMEAELPPGVYQKLYTLLLKIGNKPLIVRSSSLLEDNFGTAFAGKYESVFLGNQGRFKDRLKALAQAIGRVYASTLSPDALLYRRSKGLLDYDERMAILIQVVQGERFGRYYLPHAAGVAFSTNLYRWAPQIRREDGVVRLVWGLGTRAVDRVGNDYPRLIALSHPLLRPYKSSQEIARYSQKYVDLIDLEDNQFKTLPIQEVLNSDYPPLRFLVQIEEDGYFSSLRSNLVDDPTRLVVTFDELLKRTPFADRMKAILRILEDYYRSPVDLEFTLHIRQPESNNPSLCIQIVQCRPQSRLAETQMMRIPSDLVEEDMAFLTHFMVPPGKVDRIDYVMFVPPEGYFALTTMEQRRKLSRAIGQMNAALKGQQFILVGPGRWGSSNSDLGVPIGYGDIYHTRALVELAGPGIGPAPEPSLGTHFFQDLLESQIYPLAVLTDDPASIFNQRFFYQQPDHTSTFIDLDPELKDALRLIRVGDYRSGHCLRLVMDDERSVAAAYLVPTEDGS
jgi:hypothetical protein